MRPRRCRVPAILLSWILGAAAPGLSDEVPGEPLGVEECWRCLPTARTDEGQPLPNWAMRTARTLPRTTAAMLELDWLHRTQNPIGPVLRAEMRWVAAEANRCAYAKATAEADLRRAGAGDDRIEALKAGPGRWPAEEGPALEFARQMTVDAGSVTDDQVAELRAAYGDEQLVAMVLLLAYANFQDRLLLTLDVPLEDGGPLPPIEVHLDPEAEVAATPRARPEDLRGPAVATTVDDPEWAALDFVVLQANLGAQRAGGGRIRVPTFEEAVAKLPPGAARPKSPVRIRWSLVCMGYQPRLALAWSACTRSFGQEAAQDRVFEESLFWVVTRTIHCFY